MKTIAIRPPSMRPVDCRPFAATAAALVCLWLLLAVPPAAAAPICRWVDDSGRTHLADIVPERYKGVASCTDSAQYRIDPDRVHEAQQQARQLRQKADLGKESADQPAAAASGGSGAAPRQAAAAPAPTRRPARGVDSSTDCATWRQLYQESGECFGPYRTVGGGVKAEAFEKCRPIPSPDLKCGPVSN